MGGIYERARKQVFLFFILGWRPIVDHRAIPWDLFIDSCSSRMDATPSACTVFLGTSTGVIACWIGLLVSSGFFQFWQVRNYSRQEIIVPTLLMLVGCEFLTLKNREFMIGLGLAAGLSALPVATIILGHVAQVLSGVRTPGMGPSIFPASAIIRLGSTVRFAYIGFFQIAGNYRRLVFCTSISQAPEIVPGYHGKSDLFTFHKFFRAFRDAKLWSFDKVLFFGVLCLWFFPSFLYRIGLRSAFLFYFPFTYMGRELKKYKDPARTIRRALDASIVSVLGVVVSFNIVFWIILAGSGKTKQELENPQMMVKAIIEEVQSDPLPPLLAIIAAGITVGLYVWFRYIKVDFDLYIEESRSDLRESIEKSLKKTKIIARIRDVFAAAFVLLETSRGLFGYLSAF
jgi:hypothetical protein